MRMVHSNKELTFLTEGVASLPPSNTRYAIHILNYFNNDLYLNSDLKRAASPNRILGGAIWSDFN